MSKSEEPRKTTTSLRNSARAFIERKSFWITLMVVFLIIPTVFFFQNRYVGAPQEFGPVDTSSLGGQLPFQVILRLRCASLDGSYLSDVSDVYCQIFVRSKEQDIPEMSYLVLITDTSNLTVVECHATANGINTLYDVAGYCTQDNGSRYFELPKGDYKVSVKQFSIMGGGVVVTKGIPVEFRGELHVISEFDKRTRLSEDGASLATFLAFLFIIPAALIEFRAFLLGSKKGINS